MSDTVSDVQQALSCISSTATQTLKNDALHYLERFQRSTEAWEICNQILTRNDPSLLELQVFAVQTIRNKVTYDLSQLESSGDGTLTQLKDSLLSLLTIHTSKPILTQLNVAVARLAIQFINWKNPMIEIVSYLNPYPGILLSFLRILPEETMNMGSLPLTEEEYNSRTHELISSIAQDVLSFLVKCTGIAKTQPTNDISVANILRCFNSWSFEFPIDEVLAVRPVVELLFEVLLTESDDTEAFDAAVECLCVILKESREAPNEQLIFSLFEQLINIQTKLLPSILSIDRSKTEDELDPDLLESLTRIFAEACEAWTVFISKSPETFQPLVLILLALACKNPDLDIVSYTFPVWFSLKQNLVLPRYQHARKLYSKIFIELINGIIVHLEYPDGGFSSKENEDKFKDFRYSMGDVLKDCTAVVGTVNALTQPLTKIKESIVNGQVQNWKKLEAPLFSLRTMAQEISLTENKILPEIFQILCSLPELHPKIRYATTLVFGRYTEWTAKNPATLEIQLQYIFNGFEKVQAAQNTANEDIKDIVTASSHSLMYFCTDCSKLLSSYLDQLIIFYFSIQDIISDDIESQFELCQGLSSVINQQPPESINISFAKLIDDNLEKLEILVKDWNEGGKDVSGSRAIADKIDLFFAMFEDLKPRHSYPSEGSEPLLPEIQKLWLSLKHVLVDYDAINDNIIVERTCKFLRRLFEKFHVFCEPLLGDIAELLVKGYSTTGIGSFLWCSGSVIVIFGDDDTYPISPAIKESVWQFSLSQCGTFVTKFNKMDTAEINKYYDIVMDFFAMVSDLVMFYPKEFIMTTDLLTSIVDVALICVNKLENFDAYLYIIRCLDDIISWGFPSPPISIVTLDYVPAEWRSQIINEIIVQKGTNIVLVLMTGLVSNFDSNSHSDAVSCIVKCFRLATEANNNDPSICAQWIIEVTSQLSHVSANERENLVNSTISGLNKQDYRKVSEGIRSFVEWYIKKNVSPRID
ncbi:similar to Saccharomyces cerevisiae YOR160W MTR10 Nuclear import receptor, mediates the nuclear localization of proteins involved in mRNA-nucleus export [Maudiozyma saulgeensis]|uniref:Similar to Saccharomyces cerevisiae YOR160W MTR10 Nuclear import receptor, mediates the nuclear localization of proteins involved in mRNA-nucleus export n=1 Tax=Maudiozyma saulgeensis TaxID=1789683 RepID=A0A1X7QYH0_9SACH|nr:similar to Saccharomyces cerevisiae YOR160W MTR10 Nuclear import receptor, mediates the nuclear localization of proteins involved in mRNA-nucleus export [Kazachstania saulgeensis]